MTKIQGDYGNPIHGVSQQPDQRKFKGQCREQINCRSNLMRGLERRAGFQYVGSLTPAIDDNLYESKWVSQQRGDGGAFITAYGDEQPEIFNLNAERQDFIFQDTETEDYYKTMNEYPPNERFGISSILDTAFLTNRFKVPLGSNADDEDGIGPFPLVTWLRFRTFPPGTDVHITGTDWVYKYQVFDGFVSVDHQQDDQVPGPEKIRTQEYDGAFHAKYFATGEKDPEHSDPDSESPERGDQFNNWIRLENADAAGIKIISGSDSVTIFYNNDINAIEQLPPVASTGDSCRIIEGMGEDRNTGYFTATVKDPTTEFSEVSWIETNNQESHGVLDSSTMPHSIVRDGSNFVMRPLDWFERQVGDLNSSPYPSFIDFGDPIQSVGIFQNRLFMTAGETVHLSATDEYYDVWRASAFFNTDADPFEVYADTDELNIIKFAEQFDGDLIFFSSNGQFMIPGGETHTYSSAFIQSVSQYKADLTSDPVLAGDNLFFGTNYGNYAGVREFYTDNFADTKRSRPITDHVESYMQGQIRHMATSTNLDVLITLVDDKTEAFVYEWRWEGNERQQSAWGRWKLEHGFEFEWVGFIASELYAVVSHMILGYQLWVLDWDDPPRTHGLNYAVRTDGRFEVPRGEIIYDPENDISSWDVTSDNYAGYNHEDLVFVEGPESFDPGFVVETAEQGPGGMWTAQGNLAGVTLIAGLPYESSYTLTTPQMKDHEDVNLGLDRLQLGQLALHFSTVGQVLFDIADKHGRKRTINFNNRRMNRLDNQRSVINIDEDTWKFPIRKRTSDLEMRLYTSDVTPFTVRAIEWTGEFKQKGRRVS